MQARLLAVLILAMGLAVSLFGAPVASTAQDAMAPMKLGRAAQESKTSETPAGVAVQADPGSYTGIWKGRCLLSKVEAHVQHDGERVEGVAFVHTPTGEVNPYHFKGSVRDGRIDASHHKGHRFEGEIVDGDTVSGTITTGRKGYELSLTATRVSDTPTER